MRVTFLGLGLIGGSIARALRALPSDDGPFGGATIGAWTPSGAGPRAAMSGGTVDLAATRLEDALEGADLVVLAAPPTATLELLDRLAGPARAPLGDALVTDVASTKAAIVGRATERRLRFVGGHPMAGRETSGFAAASADLFVGRPWVVVPDAAAPADVELVAGLARACGAMPLPMAAAEHDEAAAMISHLPLVVAAALVDAVAGGAGEAERAGWPAAAALAASGWRDMTRLARGDAAMAAGIAATNAAAVATQVRALQAALDLWLTELDRAGGPDAGRLAERFRAARQRLEARD